MSVPFSFPSPTATIIGTDSASQSALSGFLNQLGIGHIQILDSWDSLYTVIQRENSTLYFVGCEQWRPGIMQWITRLKNSGMDSWSAKVFLIIPNDSSLNRVAAIQEGVDGFISYPFSLSNLHQRFRPSCRDWP
ncbi:MAG: hypothetical protein R3B74_14330 [Nitrospirales bacterium]|nr:hypothetical protein [Nitrospirales bacterium]